jgi:hypothetical protein
MTPADRVLGLVDASNQHRYPHQKGDEQEEDASNELKRSKDGAQFSPRFDNSAFSIATGLRSKALSTDKRAFFADQGLKFPLVLCRKPT